VPDWRWNDIPETEYEGLARCHEQIGDPTLADGILDRLVHNAYGIEMRGDSMRKTAGKPEGRLCGPVDRSSTHLAFG
jgi:hypothetical protein